MGTRLPPKSGAQAKVNTPENVDTKGYTPPFDTGQTTTKWPPQGWPMFSCITRASGTALSPNRTPSGKQALTAYNVHISANNAYIIEVLLGSIHLNGEASLNPALSIHFSGQEDWSLPENGAKNGLNDVFFEVQAFGRKLRPDRQMHLRAILAITYIISRIDRGLAPNIKKTLALYRLSPDD